MSKVLLTGASGFIGRHCISALTARGHEVHAVSSRCAGNAPSNNSGAIWHQADLLDTSQTRPLLDAVRPSHLLHLAWYAEPGKYWTSAENLRWVSASLELFRQFAECGGQRVVAAGTCAEYQWLDATYPMYREDSTPLLPATLYGVCKHATQSVLSSYARQSGVSAAWGRIFSLYGPHEHPSRLAASVIRSLLQNEMAGCSEGRQIRDYLYVTDVAEAFVAILEGALCGPVNIGSGIGIPVRHLVETIGEITGKGKLIQFGAHPANANEPAEIVADIRQLLGTGWKPTTALSSGLTQTIAWWEQHLSRAR